MKYPEMNWGKMEAIVNKLGGRNGVERFLRDELMLSERTSQGREQSDAIYLSVTSDGTTGLEWIKRLEKKGLRLSDYTKRVLHSKDFKPTKGVTTEIMILKHMLLGGRDEVTEKIRVAADYLKLTKLNNEMVCLFSDKFSDEDIKAMGMIWIATVLDPVKKSSGELHLGNPDSDSYLRSEKAFFGTHHAPYGGFAFVVSQS